MSKRSGVSAIRRATDSIDARLAAYVAAASAVGASSAQAAVVAHTAPQAITVNGDVNVDFNSDGQIDFQIDHDRVNLNGNNLDYLQVDKNDDNSAANPLAYPDVNPDFSQHTFPVNGTPGDNDSSIITFANPENPVNNSIAKGGTTANNAQLGGYVVALKAGDSIGSTAPDLTVWDLQEGSNFLGSDRSIRANRLIDEDAGQIDQVLGGKPADAIYVPYKPAPGPGVPDDFVGLNGATRYVGVRIDLNNKNEGLSYGWIGVKITNEADATGIVTGWAYETNKDTPILAGDTGVAGDYDSDGKVTGNDFLIWQQQFGATSAADIAANGNGNADANHDGFVNATDYNTWTGAFGTSTPVSGVVPEPGTMLMAAVGGVLLFACWLFKRRRMPIDV